MKPRVSRERGRLEEFRSKTRLQQSVSHTVYRSFELDSDVFNETRGRHHRDFLSRMPIATRNFSFFLRWKIEVLKHRLYVYYAVHSRFRRLMGDSERNVNRIIVHRSV